MGRYFAFSGAARVLRFLERPHSCNLDHLAACDVEATVPKLLRRAAQVELAEERQGLLEPPAPPVGDDRVGHVELRSSKGVLEESECLSGLHRLQHSLNAGTKLWVRLEELRGGRSLCEHVAKIACSEVALHVNELTLIAEQIADLDASRALGRAHQLLVKEQQTCASAGSCVVVGALILVHGLLERGQLRTTR